MGTSRENRGGSFISGSDVLTICLALEMDSDDRSSDRSGPKNDGGGGPDIYKYISLSD